MTAIAAREGYAAVTIAQVISHAGVSRPTFYDYFADKEDCFAAVLTDAQDQLLSKIKLALAESTPSQSIQTAVRLLIEFADTNPAIARLLIEQAMVCGPRGLVTRDLGIAKIAEAIDSSQARAEAITPLPDFPTSLLLGGIYRLLAPRLRRGEQLSGLLGDLQGWIDSYNRSMSTHRWRFPLAIASVSRDPRGSEAQLRAPIALPPGRPRISEEEVAENHRQRILFAAAEVVAKKGLAATTVAEVAKSAGLDSRAFYRQFRDKQEVFAAAHELYFRHVMATTASGFFSSQTASSAWPDRAWEAGRAFTQSIIQNPSLAHLTFVEFYAAGPAALERHTDLMMAFTVFLQEGYRDKTPGESPTPLALEAIAATNFEIVYRQIRDHKATRLAGLLPLASYLSLAPFLGTEKTNRFIDAKLGKSNS